VIILDANVLIAFLDEQDPHHRDSKDLIEANFVEGFGVSAVTLAEALVYPAKAGKEDRALFSIRRLGVKTIGVEPDDGMSIAHLRANHTIRMPDALVLLCALPTGSRIATFDRGLKTAAHEAGLGTVEVA